MAEDERETLKRPTCKRIESINHDINAFKAGCAQVSPDRDIGRLTRLEAISSERINEAALRKTRAASIRLEKAHRAIDFEIFV